MKFKTTFILFIAVGLLGAFIFFFEQRTDSTSRRDELAKLTLRIDSSKISILRFEFPDRQIECAKDGGTWTLVSPVRARADVGAIERILLGLEAMPRGEVITAADRSRRGLTAADYGLDQPRLKIIAGDSLQRKTLWVGRESPLGDALYVQVEGSEDILSTGTNLLEVIPQSYTDLRDRALFRDSPESVKRLEVQWAAGLVQVSRQGRSGWMIQQPIVARADSGRVRELLDVLYFLHIDDFVTDSAPDLGVYDLDEPTARISVVTDEKAGPQTLLLGKLVDAEPGKIYAKLKSESFVYTVTTDSVMNLNLKLDDWRDRRLVTMSSYDVSHVQIQEGERKLELTRNEIGEWFMLEPQRWKADAETVNRVLTDLCASRIDTFIDSSLTNLTDWGLEPPARTIYLSTRSSTTNETGSSDLVPGEDAAAIQVSIRSHPGHTIVKLAHEPGLYELSNSVFTSVSLNPRYYRDREVLSLTASNILFITRKAGGKEIQLVRQGDNTYLPSGGGEIEMDAVKDFLMTVSNLRVADFITDDMRSAGDYGLSPPNTVISIGLGGEGGLGKTLLLGNELGENGIYGMVQGDDIVFVLDRGTREHLLKDLLKQPTTSGADIDGGAQ